MKIYIAVCQEPMACLDDCAGETLVQVFRTREEAERLVDNWLAEYEEGDERDRMNWEIYERTINL